MKIIVCLDDSNGMLFNKRRQSKDREIIKDLEILTSGARMMINNFSGNLFEESDILPETREDFLEVAGDNDYCLIENRDAREYLPRISEIVIYKWNRKYPGDFTFSINPTADGFKLQESKDFKGYSHDKITREIYVK